MPNANTTLVDAAEDSGKSVATYNERQPEQHRGVRPWPFTQHIPGDTRTPPAPGAVWIGSGDA